MIQVVETYDSFRPEILWGVEFRLRKPSEPRLVHTFRSAYLSIRQIYDGAMTHLVQAEFPLNDDRREKKYQEEETGTEPESE